MKLFKYKKLTTKEQVNKVIQKFYKKYGLRKAEGEEAFWNLVEDLYSDFPALGKKLGSLGVRWDCVPFEN